MVAEAHQNLLLMRNVPNKTYIQWNLFHVSWNTSETVYMKYSERKVSQCILALWKSLKLFEEERKIICSQSGMQKKKKIQ